MALNSLADYSTTPALNTDIGGISTDGATQTVNNVDNLVRELMSHLAAHNQTPSFVSTSAAASSGPALTLYRNSASPAAADYIGTVIFNGEDSAGNTQTYAEIAGKIIDPTSTSEDGALELYTTIAGSAAVRATFGAGLYMSGATDPGAGRMAASGLTFPATQDASANANTLDDYEEGITSPTVTATSGSFTAVSCSLTYTKVGNNVDVRAVITMSNAGTAAGGLVFDVPFTAANNSVVSGYESDTGFASNGRVVTATATIYKYDGTTIIATGRVLHIHTNFKV